MHYVFADYTLDPEHYEILQTGIRVQLEPRVFNLLAYLVQHPGRTVTKEELRQQLWPDQPFMSDDPLTNCVAQARKALGDSGQAQRYIKTIRGRGYRFIAPVEERLGEGVERETQCVSAVLRLPPAGLQPPTSEVPAAERKLVTVLSGVLSLPDSAGQEGTLEDMHRLMQAVHTRILHAVQQYDGTLQHVTDDGFLAVFGVPVAQEDHAQRAVRTALALKHWLDAAPTPLRWPSGAPFALRLALHTGLVAVGPLGGDPQRTAIVGGVTTMAGTLARHAPPGTILASEATVRLVREEVHAVRLPSHRLDDPPLPVPVYELRGMQQQRGPRAALTEHPRSPFMGRDAELAVLRVRLALVERGQGQVVGIVGESGIGKSRLLEEFQQAIRSHQVTYLQGRCQSYGHAIPYLPLVDLLRSAWRITDTDDAEAITAKMAAGLQVVNLPPDTLAPYFLHLLGMPATLEPFVSLSPEVTRERTFEALHQFHLSSSRQRPCVLEIENLHWIDATSDAYLAALVEWLAGVPLLLLVTFRPGYQPSWLDKSYVTQIALQPLGPEDSLHVVRAVVQHTQLSAALEQQILMKAEGNPFFLEELAQAVVEQGDNAPIGTVPNTIQAVLAARIDRLPLAEKHLLQAAAAIGTEVPLGLLQAVVEAPEGALRQHLLHLQAAEFLYETHLFPERKYTFKHVLTQEVAYGSLLREQRCTLHAKIIDAMEGLAADRVADQVEWLAHQALQGERWDKALYYFRQAGAKAAARSAHREAVTCFEYALLALHHLPQGHDTYKHAIDLRFDLRNSLTLLGELGSMLDHLREAEALAEALGDEQRRGWVCAYMTQYCSIAGDQHQAIAAGQRALAIAVSRDDLALQTATHFFLGLAYHALGNYPQAIEYLSRNVADLTGDLMHESLGMANLPAVISRTWLAWCLAECGDFAAGITHAEEGVQIAEAVNHPASCIQAYCGVGSLCLRQGNLEQAIAVFERGLELCQVWNIRSRVPWMASFLGTAYALCGRLTEALPLLKQAVDQSATLRAMRYQALWVAGLSAGYRRAGRTAEAMALASHALELSRTHKERGNEAYAFALLGEIVAQGDPLDIPHAASYYRHANALAQQLGMRPLQAHCHLGLGTLHAKSGHQERAYNELSAAISLYRAMQMPFWLHQAETALAQVA